MRSVTSNVVPTRVARGVAAGWREVSMSDGTVQHITTRELFLVHGIGDDVIGPVPADGE